MRLKQIALENFRCFRLANIDLSADIVAIYGRNGVGKTAIFDAIQFALLGSIGRFTDEPTPPDYLLHVFSDDKAVIRIDFKGDTDSWVKLTIDRMSNFNTYMESSGGWRNHNELLYEFLINKDYSPPRKEISTAAELFRATVLLSQDSIRHFVEGDVAERSRILSYLAGSGYSQRCLDKVKVVMKDVRKREKAAQFELNEAKTNAMELKARVAEQNARIAAIREKIGNDAISYDTALSALESAGISVSNIVIPQTAEESEAFSAAISGTCKERILMLDDRNKLLAQLEAMSQQHPDRLNRRRELHDMVEKARKDLTELLKKENDAAENIKDLDNRLSKLKLKTSEKSKYFQALKTLQELQHRQTELMKDRNSTLDKIAHTHSRLDPIKVDLEEHQAEWDLAKKDKASYLTEAEKASSHLEKLKELRASLPDYAVARGQVRQLESLISELGKKRSTLEEKIAELRNQHLKLNEKIGKLDLHIAGMKASSREATNLITRLRQYATGSKCPLCGHIHPSAKALEDAIIAQNEDIPTAFQEAGKELQNLSDKLAILNANIDGFGKELSQVNNDLFKAKNDREKSVSYIYKIENNAAVLDTPLADGDVEAAINKIQAFLSDLQTRLRPCEERFNKADNQLKDAMDKIRSLEEVLAKETEVYKENQHKLDSTELQLVELGLSNESGLPEDQLLQIIDATRTQLSDLEMQKTTQETAMAEAQNERYSSRTERLNVESNMKEWEQTIGRLTAEIEDFYSKCKALTLPMDASADVITKAITLLSEDKERLYAAKQTIERYEWSLKVSTIEREQKELQRQTEDAEQSVKKRKEQVAELREAFKEAESWISPLSESVNRTVEKKIAVHQPEIVRLFKAMIPCPYLFDNVTMKREEDGLRLGLQYRGQEQNSGEPRFFLSSAQANVLALSIFLSLGGKKQWSQLDTVLLDDPVQHLDDLDAVAFLDNLRALALGRFVPKKQVIVSTCDKNMYLLMIRKFLLLKEAGISFTGISLLDKGTDGPEIIYDVGGPLETDEKVWGQALTTLTGDTG